MRERSPVEIAHKFVREFQNCVREALDSDPAIRVLEHGCQQPIGDDLSGTGVPFVVSLSASENHKFQLAPNGDHSIFDSRRERGRGAAA